MECDTIKWRKGTLELLDQRALPGRMRYVKCRTVKDVWEAINNLTVRGAPAIGVVAAFGVYLGVRESKALSTKAFIRNLKKTLKHLASARPTARNLFWALERIERTVEDNSFTTVPSLKRLILREANEMLEEDKRVCRNIGLKGKKLIPKGTRVLTHCNAGGLATAGYGTALSVLYAAKNKIKRVYADETRPVLQGERLTVGELMKSGMPTTLICDNMAASLMAEGEIDAVIVGADRIAANGDTANKIGTYNLAVLAHYHGVPFYVAAPASTFDLSIKTGKKIPIEERPKNEVRKMAGEFITVRDVDVRNKAFDVTPAGMITAIVTEKGIIYKPNKDRIAKTVK